MCIDQTYCYLSEIPLSLFTITFHYVPKWSKNCTEMVHPLVPKWYKLIRHVARVPKLDCTEVVHPLVPKWSCTELVLTRLPHSLASKEHPSCDNNSVPDLGDSKLPHCVIVSQKHY